MNIFETIFYQPLFNILIILYDLLGNNLGLAIIAIALIFRFLMIPLTRRQIKMAESSREFSEKSKEIKKKYKNNKQKQQEELMKLNAEYLPAQIGGCLPLILQFVLFIYLYYVITDIINEGIRAFNEVAYSFAPSFSNEYSIDLSFFGIVDLGKAANDFNLLSLDALPYIIIVILVGASQYFSMKITSAMKSKREENNGEKTKDKAKDKKKGNKKDKNEPEDFAEIMQRSTRQAMLLIPFLTIFISFNLPSGVGIYWITQSSFVIIQQFVFGKLEERKKNKENIKTN